MLSEKEVLSLALLLIVLAFSNAFINPSLFLVSLVFFFIILAVYISSKKFLAYILEAETEEKVWSFQRYWFNEGDYFKTPIPLGIILPFLLSILSLGAIRWFAVAETDIKTTLARTAKRHDFYSFSELTEWHIACVSSAGIFSLLVLAFLAYLLNFPELAKLAVYFSAFNMLPLGNLDGTKIFFGSKILYAGLLSAVLIALSYSLFLV